jgi:2-polyprenyl-3-methyl-5-hydroxy-6-metoxy-1,4-benzoquinol methylase
MGYIRLRSTNPRLSYILRKNPESGMQIRKIGQGFGFGWYAPDVVTNPIKEYNMYFQDLQATSYPDGSNDSTSADYLNRGRYVHPQMYLDLLDEFASFGNKPDPDDIADIFEHSLMISYLKIKAGTFLESFRKAGYRIEVLNSQDKYGTIVITTQDSIRNLINYARLLCVILMARRKNSSGYRPNYQVDWCQKYATMIQKLDLDFYLRYYFSKTFLFNRAIFDKIRPILETSSRYRIELAYGDTAVQRSDFVNAEITMDHHLLDIGCGEGYYLSRATRLAEKGKSYYGVDPNQALVDRLRHRIQLKNHSNTFIFESLDEALDAMMEQQMSASGPSKEPEPLNVLLLEVIEHMSKEEAATLVRRILTQVPISKLLISTPNAEFNKFYSTSQATRHPDHHWEMTSTEFSTWITQLVASIPEKAYSVKLVSIGHRVDGIATTQGAVIEPTINPKN